MSDQIIARVSQSLAKEQSLESLVRQLLEMLEMVTDMESTYLTKVDIEARLQHIMFARNSQKMHIPENFSVCWDYSLCKRAIDENCFFSDDVPDRWGDCIAARNLGITTFLSTPVHLPDGSFYGTLCAASSEKRPWSERAEQVLQLFAGLIAQYIQKEALVEQLREANAALIAQSYTDALTGLPNRRAIIAFIDLDNFKLINDRFGHNAGDLFLIQVGERLNTLHQNGEIIGRLGGDEFLVVSLADENANIPSLRGRIEQQIRGEYRLGDINLFYPGASLGIVEVDPETTDADSALHAADVAMYQEKKHKEKTPFVAHSALHS
ncbi:sensor domain-containing diguanylate cyclase [Escherichia albertii]|uniref:sensor domain-containing diguanylate cyclase n=1 Tax=Escherichia albertii TaxID=208962 RepID=UPI001A169F56|nr:sensor domain-containing diguanylate cyclase [Escherichia albertii]MCU7294275.1 sensor domain-containing diguanylate cyclase [Escherichia albertii]MCZ8922952.1 sensor domain-containing diguanylate cyclase [Escherichia albertii]MCZ9151739.1 sensor domain-containing diguanylate cyclase [Escherichia albertii]MCZ9160470.1 sensor domain-containing diguanylate cyclase [Escherichia albertii]MCZ9218474.1 sensor domain-containing diguanylate cyclase [Escherichia albertii]